MKLVITTPTAVVADRDGVVHVRAEDASGAFGILPRHADFLTALTVSVVSWRHADGSEGHCAVRGGVLTVSGGRRVAVATREAAVGEDLHRLEAEVLTRFRRAAEEEEAARADLSRLRVAALRQILGYLRPERGGSGPVPPAGG